MTRRPGRPKAASTKKLVSLRQDPEVIDCFKAAEPGANTLNDTLAWPDMTPTQADLLCELRRQNVAARERIRAPAPRKLRLGCKGSPATPSVPAW